MVSFLHLASSGITLGNNAFITYTFSAAYHRSLEAQSLANPTSNQRKRDQSINIQQSRISVSIRTRKFNGTIFYAAGSATSSILQVKSTAMINFRIWLD